MAAMAKQLGAPSSLEDFERKVQLMNYVSHRALFEGFNAHLWIPNSGRLLWMSQPAWPSFVWQLYGSNYDTYGSYYGAKKACEPIHVQLNLPDLKVAVVNNTANPLEGLSVRARVFSLDGREISSHMESVRIPANSTIDAFPLVLPKKLNTGLAFVKLELLDRRGAPISDNFYWQTTDASSLQELNQMPPASVHLSVELKRTGKSMLALVELENTSDAIALLNKVTVRDEQGNPILPAYAAENYVSLLPFEKQLVEVEYPLQKKGTGIKVGLDGWNTSAVSVAAH